MPKLGDPEIIHPKQVEMNDKDKELYRKAYDEYLEKMGIIPNPSGLGAGLMEIGRKPESKILESHLKTKVIKLKSAKEAAKLTKKFGELK